MERDELLAVVKETLSQAMRHWVETGTAVKPEDAELVADDVAKALGLFGLLKK